MQNTLSTRPNARTKAISQSPFMRPANQSAQIIVADNGIGISAENLTRVFAHGLQRSEEGHGFGLHSGALAARAMGGSLSVASAGLGHGATFTLELPIALLPKQTPMNSDSLPAVPENRRILVIDDNPLDSSGL